MKVSLTVLEEEKNGAFLNKIFDFWCMFQSVWFRQNFYQWDKIGFEMVSSFGEFSLK